MMPFGKGFQRNSFWPRGGGGGGGVSEPQETPAFAIPAFLNTLQMGIWLNQTTLNSYDSPKFPATFSSGNGGLGPGCDLREPFSSEVLGLVKAQARLGVKETVRCLKECFPNSSPTTLCPLLKATCV